MVSIFPATPSDYREISVMVGHLLEEIMEAIGENVFRFDQAATETRIAALVGENRYWIFAAKDESGQLVGFISLCESHALYAEGTYGIIPELFVLDAYRSKAVGRELLSHAILFAQEKKWNRLEVTTPPLPEFSRTLEFYQDNNFEITGGRKMKVSL